MAMKNSVSKDFCSMFVDSINVFDCHLSGVKAAIKSLNSSFLVMLPADFCIIFFLKKSNWKTIRVLKSLDLDNA